MPIKNLEKARGEYIAQYKQGDTYWQSIRSVIPPCPGILCPKSLMLNARLNPDAKNPPKGATSEAKQARNRRCNW